MNVLFGFRDDHGVARKVAKFAITKRGRELRQIVIVQYDSRHLSHNTLHYTVRDDKAPRYHEQLEHPEMFAQEDRDKFPEIIDQRIPRADEIRDLWPLQAIPVWFRTDIEVYDRMKSSEVERNLEGIADARGLASVGSTSGLLETYLLAPGNTVALARHKERLSKRRLLCWRVLDTIEPWLLGYIIAPALSRKRRAEAAV